MTMRKRLFLSASIMAGFVCAVLVVLAMLPPKPGVTKANFDLIENGMTEEEVELAFGESGRDIAFNGWKSWRSPNESWTNIAFIDGRVVNKEWVDRDRETAFDKLRRWLRL